jgi:hypothetical protein
VISLAAQDWITQKLVTWQQLRCQTNVGSYADASIKISFAALALVTAASVVLFFQNAFYAKNRAENHALRDQIANLNAQIAVLSNRANRVGALPSPRLPAPSFQTHGVALEPAKEFD